MAICSGVVMLNVMAMSRDSMEKQNACHLIDAILMDKFATAGQCTIIQRCGDGSEPSSRGVRCVRYDVDCDGDSYACVWV